MAREYQIDIAKLKLGRHSFSFAVAQDFFAHAPEAGIEAAEVAVQVALEKSTRQIDAHFELDGRVQVPCDRCAEPLWLDVATRQRVIYSFEPSVRDAESEDIQFIAREAQYLDLRQDIHDFILLTLPMRRVPGPGSSHQCPPEVLRLLAEGAAAAERQAVDAGPEAPLEEGPDPRWSALRGLQSTDN